MIFLFGDLLQTVQSTAQIKVCFLFGDGNTLQTMDQRQTNKIPRHKQTTTHWNEEEIGIKRPDSIVDRYIKKSIWHIWIQIIYCIRRDMLRTEVISINSMFVNCVRVCVDLYLTHRKDVHHFNQNNTRHIKIGKLLFSVHKISFDLCFVHPFPSKCVMAMWWVSLKRCHQWFGEFDWTFWPNKW